MVLPGAGGAALTILGGLTTGDTSSSGIYLLDTTQGALSHVGSLAEPLHDAAGAVLGGRDVVMGGGSPSTVGGVEAYPSAATAGGGATTASVIGTLPQPRSDATEVTTGTTGYVVGGYDGTTADADVLSTVDGRTFHPVAALPVPVRYPAVAAVNGKIYVFGGQAIAGAAAGDPVTAIQMVDPARRTASVVGHLPETLSGAAAVTMGAHIYVIGGESAAPQSNPIGVGTTQLVPSGTSTNPGAGASGAITDGYGGAATGPGRARVVAVTTPPVLHAVSTIFAFDPRSASLSVAGRLQVPVAHAGVALVGSTAWVVGGESASTPLDVVQMVTPNAGFGTAGAAGAGSPYFGDQLLVADRGNNRLLLLDTSMHVTWQYPAPTLPSDPLGFYFPDDAFFIKGGTAIISNQEQNETIVEIGYPSGKILWSYGHPHVAGTGPGYLHEPDDAYLLKNGEIAVADAQNCRVLLINADGTVAGQIGTTGRCRHDPPASMGSPNGDTPLADGNLLVSEINGSWISEYTPAAKLVWTVHLPISYPSDPQQIGPDAYLAADYAAPGQLLEFDRAGAVTYRYGPAQGPGSLNHPSLAELLPSGVIMINDDYRNRMVAIDPKTGALVWQYGVNDTAGTATGMLNTPDGFDLLGPGGITPTHPATG